MICLVAGVIFLVIVTFPAVQDNQNPIIKQMDDRFEISRWQHPVSRRNDFMITIEGDKLNFDL